jgi:hypothetical protein
LDSGAYPATIYDGEPVPWPEWACKAPDGGIHKSARIGRLDVQVAAIPPVRLEITWTCRFSVTLLTRAWLEQVHDLIDHERTFLGSVRKDGDLRDDWVTVHEQAPPALETNEGHHKVCPICGAVHWVIYGDVFFSDPAVFDRDFIVNDMGVFVREDLAIKRGLRTPVGAFRPRRVGVRRGA